MESYIQYQEWVKPFFAPPEWIFSVVWPVLYVFIAISFGWVFYKIFVEKKIPEIIALPFLLNLFFNVIFTPILFGLKDFSLALVDVTLVWITIVWLMWVIKKYSKWVFYMQVPYLIWVSFATILQFSVWWLN